jgi:hypothetical protein
MADAKITELPEAPTIATDDLLCVVTGVSDVPETMKVDVNRFVAQSVKPSDLLVQGDGVTLTTNAAPDADSPETVTISAATDTIGQDIFPIKVATQNYSLAQNTIITPLELAQTIADGTQYMVSTHFVFNIGNGLTSTQQSAISGGLDSDQFITRGNWVHYEAISKEHLELHQDATQQIANTGTWVSFGNNPSSIFNVPCTVTSQQQFYVKNDSGGDLTLQLEIVTNHNFVGNDSIALLTGSSVTYTKVT